MFTIAAQIVLHSARSWSQGPERATQPTKKIWGRQPRRRRRGQLQERGRKRRPPNKKPAEKWERSRRNLEEKIKAKKKFIEQQNIIQKTALAKGENLKSADALRQNLRAVEPARVTVERESKELNALQEDLARHMGKKPKNSWVARPMQQVSIFGDVVYPRVGFQFASKWSV